MERKFVEISGKPCELKGSSTVWRGAVGNTGYAVRWPPTQLNTGLDEPNMLAFCPGAILFYFLLYKSGVVPRWLSLWGLVSVLPLLVGTVTAVFNYDLPFVLFLPYVPFELVIAIWILIKGNVSPPEFTQ